MKYFKEMTPDWEKEICADLMSGMKVNDITSKHHIGKPRLYEIMYRNGIERTRAPAPKRRRYTTPRPAPKVPPTEEEVFMKEFPRLWDEATKPFRDMIHQREKKTGLYWR